MLNLHETPTEFLAAIKYTLAETGFRAELIEKDYFCSVVLSFLASLNDSPLIFKGGTMLTKVHNDFFRLSEDLDFTIPISSSATRADRKRVIKPIKKIFNFFANVSGVFIDSELIGSNESKQYNGEIKYKSIITQEIGKIRFEVSVREPLIDEPANDKAKTLLLNPFTNASYFSTVATLCFSKHEAYAEKVRAALCRSQPAIRDFFDIDHAIRNDKIDFNDQKFLDAIVAKLNVPETLSIDLSNVKLDQLNTQIKAELFPTLRPIDYDKFQLYNVYEKLRSLVKNYDL